MAEEAGDAGSTAVSKPTVRLDLWAVEIKDPGPFRAPELGRRVLTGIPCSGEHEGHPVHCSRALKIDGRRVETKNTIYQLGRISPEYRRWLRMNCSGWDWRNPIAFREVK